MIFNEIYSAYYNSVAKIVSEILKGGANEKELSEIVSQKAFGESILSILPSLKSEKWQVVKGDLTTPIKHIPTMPLTDIEKRWLKAILCDPRIKLFDIEIGGLDDTEPLFTSEDYYIYDKYSDGDPYDDEKYISHFRTILNAINSRQNIKIEMTSRKGNVLHACCCPERLEYSEKDDKFRLITKGCRFLKTVNLARITRCRLYTSETEASFDEPEAHRETITLKVSEERNTLERCMLHFAHFEKRAERFDDHYLLHINYDKDDESEMVIRVLSFGPMVEVLGTDNFKNLIIDRLKRQKSCGLL